MRYIPTQFRSRLDQQNRKHSSQRWLKPRPRRNAGIGARISRLNWTAITSIVTAITAIGALIASTVTLSNATESRRLEQRGQASQRYITSIQQLASPLADIRIGGIYSLEQLAKDSPADFQPIFEVIAAFVRTRAAQCPTSEQGQLARLEPEIQIALTVIARRDISAPINDSFQFDLSGACLPGAVMKGAILKRVNLSGARLDRANFEEADLTEATLEGSSLSDVQFTDAKLKGANFDYADASRTLFIRGSLENARFINSTLNGADFDGANLSWADFKYAHLSGATFHGADLPHASFLDATLNNVNLYGTDLRRAFLLGADLHGATLTDSNLTEATISKDEIAICTRAESVIEASKKPAGSCIYNAGTVWPNGLVPPP